MADRAGLRTIAGLQLQGSRKQPSGAYQCGHAIASGQCVDM